MKTTLTIDRSKPFDPTFFGTGWTVESENPKAIALTEVDFTKVTFDSFLREGEETITGEEKLSRATDTLLLDAKIGQLLYEQKNQPLLNWLYDKKGICWMEFAGTVLRDSVGRRYFLYLLRQLDGSWHWYYNWLGHGRHYGFVSPLLASALTLNSSALIPLDFRKKLETAYALIGEVLSTK